MATKSLETNTIPAPNLATGPDDQLTSLLDQSHAEEVVEMPRSIAFPGVALGALSLSHTVLPPPGYAYTERIDEGEATNLMRNHYPISEGEATEWHQNMADYIAKGGTLHHVGLRHEQTGDLAAMGTLSHDNGEGQLDNLVVHRDHRRKKLGKTLIDERLAIAKQLGLEKIEVPDVADTNSLKTYYSERGFTEGAEADLIYMPEAPTTKEG